MFLLVTTKSKKNYVKYLGVYINDKLTWKNQIDHLCSKLLKTCGMVFKLRYYVPLSTSKLIYYSLFHSNIQYSLLNWGRAAKSYFHNLKILQNKILKAILFCPSCSPTNLPYSKLKVLKLDDMINMEIAKFMFKFNNQMLPDFSNKYFTKLDNFHSYNTKQTTRPEFFQYFVASESRRKTLHHVGLKVWKNVPKEFRHCSFSTYKKKILNKCPVKL